MFFYYFIECEFLPLLIWGQKVGKAYFLTRTILLFTLINWLILLCERILLFFFFLLHANTFKTHLRNLISYFFAFTPLSNLWCTFNVNGSTALSLKAVILIKWKLNFLIIFRIGAINIHLVSIELTLTFYIFSISCKERCQMWKGVPLWIKDWYL